MDFSKLVDQVWNTVEAWMTEAAALLPNFAVAVVVVLLGYAVGRLLGSLAERSLSRVSDNAQATALIGQLVRTGVLVGSLFAALGVMQLDGTVKSLLAGVGVIGLALGFAFQDIAANFVSGVMLAFRRQFNRGDLIEAAGFFGIIEKVNLRSTVGRTFQGQRVIIPNKEVFNATITNFTCNNERRLDLAVGVSYDDDLEKAQKAAIEAVSNIEGRQEGRDVEALYTGFGGSSIDMVIRVWVKPEQRDYLEAQSQAIIAVKKAFDKNEISIPFPIRTLDVGKESSLALAEAFASPARSSKQKATADAAN